MKLIKKNQAVLWGALLMTSAMDVAAVPITGAIGMGGNYIAVNSEWVETGTAAATGIDFAPNNFMVTSKTGSFLLNVSSGMGNITDFQFDPVLGVNDGLDGITTVSSIVDFWTIDDFSFELTSVARGFTNDPDTFLVLEGTGIMRATNLGLDDTMGTWSFSGNTSGSVFTWSAGSSVPEPGILALMCIGLIGFVAGRRK